jgi:hypothetical protein
MILKALSLVYHATLSRDPQRRYESRFELLGAVAYRLGFELYNRNLYWPDDDGYRSAWQQFRPGDPQIKDRKFVLYSMARALSSLPGDTAECGVFDGGSSFLMCLPWEGSSEHHHHVFDSFEGLSKPEDADLPEDPTAYLWQAHDLAVPLETVKRNLRRFDFVRYYPGWIPERFGEVADRRFSFVHVDVDLFQPTYDAVAFFYPRMVPGGIILCDDYGSTICPGARKAFDDAVRGTPEGRVIELTTGQGFIVKRGGDIEPG